MSSGGFVQIMTYDLRFFVGLECVDICMSLLNVGID